MSLRKPDHSFITLLFRFTFTIFLFASCQEFRIDDLEKKIHEIGNQWIPDSREGIFDISIIKGKAGTLILSGETSSTEALDAITSLIEKSSDNILNQIKLLPDTSSDKNYRGLITLSVANLRSRPEYEAELVSQAILGTPVRIFKKAGSWLLIQTPDRYVAWTNASSVKSLSNNEFTCWKKTDRIIFLTNSGYVYDTPAEEAIVSDLVAGAILEKTSSTAAYTGVRFPDGRTGYVRNNQIKDFNDWKETRFDLKGNTLSIARSLNGLPYLWGGNSSKALDCSGFVKTVYFMNGIILARDASQQCQYGIDIDISSGLQNLQKGDLLFFGTQKDTTYRITHVALYMGDSEFMHSSGMVMTNSLDSSRSNYSHFRNSTLARARRIDGVNKSGGIIRITEHPWY